MTLLLIQVTILVFVAIAGTAVVLTRDPRNQVVGISFYGLLLALAFFIYQAPDVALSQIVIGAVALPLMFMLALTKVRRDKQERAFFEKRESGKQDRQVKGPEAA
jgi:energy-converting hydrogenase B subunit D